MAMINPESRKQKTSNKRGFALLVSVIFMSVMLALGIALSSLGYKQQLLASTAIESQYAFYAADAGLECALYADQQLDSFNYLANQYKTPTAIVCDQTSGSNIGPSNWTTTRLLYTSRISIDANTGNPRCVDVTVYKLNRVQPPTTYIYSQGYDVPCATVTNPSVGARFVSRGLGTSY